MDCNPPGSSVHEILQARILEWVAISSSRGTSQPRDWTCISHVSCTGRWVLYHTREAQSSLYRVAIALSMFWILSRLLRTSAQSYARDLSFTCGRTERGGCLTSLLEVLHGLQFKLSSFPILRPSNPCGSHQTPICKTPSWTIHNIYFVKREMYVVATRNLQTPSLLRKV